MIFWPTHTTCYLKKPLRPFFLILFDQLAATLPQFRCGGIFSVVDPLTRKLIIVGRILPDVLSFVVQTDLHANKLAERIAAFVQPVRENEADGIVLRILANGLNEGVSFGHDPFTFPSGVMTYRGIFFFRARRIVLHVPDRCFSSLLGQPISTSLALTISALRIRYDRGGSTESPVQFARSRSEFGGWITILQEYAACRITA
jgi:hypothetical protein